MRPQYTTQKCGQCGQKRAYVTTTRLSFGALYLVKCKNCKAEKWFCEYGGEGMPEKWPGTLEEAAALLEGEKKD